MYILGGRSTSSVPWFCPTFPLIAGLRCLNMLFCFLDIFFLIYLSNLEKVSLSLVLSCGTSRVEKECWAIESVEWWKFWIFTSISKILVQHHKVFLCVLPLPLFLTFRVDLFRHLSCLHTSLILSHIFPQSDSSLEHKWKLIYSYSQLKYFLILQRKMNFSWNECIIFL